VFIRLRVTLKDVMEISLTLYYFVTFVSITSRYWLSRIDRSGEMLEWVGK
jgi:antibiotic biosynthesis monooxygenase (ABM) superfamily enzyme